MMKLFDSLTCKCLGVEKLKSMPKLVDFTFDVNEKVRQSFIDEADENLNGESNAHDAERFAERDLDFESCHKCPIFNNRGDIPIPRTECNNQAIDDADKQKKDKTLKVLLQMIGQYTKRYVRENEARILRDIFHNVLDRKYIELAPLINEIEGKDEYERRNIIINDIHHNANQVMNL